MFITKGHFLSPFVQVIKNGKPLKLIHSIDTEMLVAIRVVGFESETEAPILDLVKVDEVQFVSDRMPSQLQELLPEGCTIVSEEEYREEFEDGTDSTEGSE